jgi:hypothetical protein
MKVKWISKLSFNTEHPRFPFVRLRVGIHRLEELKMLQPQAEEQNQHGLVIFQKSGHTKKMAKEMKGYYKSITSDTLHS